VSGVGFRRDRIDDVRLDRPDPRVSYEREVDGADVLASRLVEFVQGAPIA
jgi:hypothetical protein